MKTWKESTGRTFYRCYTCSHCSSVVTSSHIGSEKDTSQKMVKEFVLIEHQEYNHLKDIPTINDISENMDVRDTSVLSIQQLLNAVRRRIGIMYHSKVDNLFAFLKTHPSVLSWSDFGEAIVNGWFTCSRHIRLFIS